MLPWIPVFIITDFDVYHGAAFEKDDYCIFIAPKEISSATIALVDLSAYIDKEKPDLIEVQGMRIPPGTLYAIKCEVESNIRLKGFSVCIGKIISRYKSESYPPDILNLKDISIPVRIEDIITRVDERYVSRLRVFEGNKKKSKRRFRAFRLCRTGSSLAVSLSL